MAEISINAACDSPLLSQLKLASGAGLSVSPALTGEDTAEGISVYQLNTQAFQQEHCFTAGKFSAGNGIIQDIQSEIPGTD